MDENMITIKTINSRPIVKLTGIVRGEGDKRLKVILHDMFLDVSNTIVVVDISDATYIDSHFLGTIVYYHRKMQENGRKLILFNTCDDPETYMNSLINCTGIDKVLTVARSEDEIK